MDQQNAKTAFSPTLDDLEVDDVDDNELAGGLHGRIGLVKGEDRVRLLGDSVSAIAKKKIIAVALARHAMERKAWITAENIPASTEWFAVQIQQKPKSVGEELSRLKKAGLLERNNSGWFVPRWALREAVQFVRD